MDSAEPGTMPTQERGWTPQNRAQCQHKEGGWTPQNRAQCQHKEGGSGPRRTGHTADTRRGADLHRTGHRRLRGPLAPPPPEGPLFAFTKAIS